VFQNVSLSLPKTTYICEHQVLNADAKYLISAGITVNNCVVANCPFTFGTHNFALFDIRFPFLADPSDSPVFACFLAGLVAILSGAGGQFLGGFTVMKAKLSVRQILIYCICFAFASLASVLILLLSCPNLSKCKRTMRVARALN